MKSIINLFLVVTLLACQPSGPAVLKGKVDMGKQSRFELFVRDRGIDTLHIDKETLEFNKVFELDSPRMINLYGVVGEGNQRFPMQQILYLEPGGDYKLQMVLHDRKVEMTIQESGIENKLLIDCNALYIEKIKQLWNSNPTPDTFQDSLFQIYSEIMKFIEKSAPKQLVKKYLEIKAYVSYFSDYESFSYQFYRNKQQVPEQNHAQLPVCYEVLDHPMALQFDYYLNRCIYRQLEEKTKQPEEQISLLQEWFKTKEIREATQRYICQLFIDRVPYNEENYERLKGISAGIQDQEKMLKAYRDKRYAVVGAPWPDLTFEDQSGKKHQLSEFKGKYVYIDLWASWCGPCCAEVPHLKKLEKELKNSNVVFVSISLDSNRDAWLKKMEQLDMHGNQWHSADGEFAKMLNVKSIPHFVLYDKDGNLMQYKAARPSSGERLKKMLSGLK